ncbi:hypothetical protein [Pantoea sp. B65]|uniref:hypothetical protein n=1 Tax=Pantoea sp. B65 TaxID=2813359 RepID=UPI0039B59102
MYSNINRQMTTYVPPAPPVLPAQSQISAISTDTRAISNTQKTPTSLLSPPPPIYSRSNSECVRGISEQKLAQQPRPASVPLVKQKEPEIVDARPFPAVAGFSTGPSTTGKQKIIPQSRISYANAMTKQPWQQLSQNQQPALNAPEHRPSALSQRKRMSEAIKANQAASLPYPDSIALSKLSAGEAGTMDINQLNITSALIKHPNFYSLNFSKLNNHHTSEKIDNYTANKHIVVITGNSGMSYNKNSVGNQLSDMEKVKNELRQIYDHAIEKSAQGSKDKILIACGGTVDGGICNLAAEIAAEKNLTIFGITSSQAVDYQCLSDRYHKVFVIKNETWEVPGQDGISLFARMAANKAELNRTGEMHAIEGGEITVRELKDAGKLGVKPVLHLGFAADPAQISKRQHTPGFDPTPVSTWAKTLK